MSFPTPARARGISGAAAAGETLVLQRLLLDKAPTVPEKYRESGQAHWAAQGGGRLELLGGSAGARGGATLTRRLPSRRRRSARAAAVIHWALPGFAHSGRQGSARVGEGVASEPRGCSHPEQAGRSRRALSAPAGASKPRAISGLSRPPGSPPAPEAAAARPERSGGGATLGAGRERRPPRTPQSRSRRLDPTSAETKMPEHSANTREAEDTSLDVKQQHLLH
ncbi:uncharacterized protein LOC128776904 [Panthera pardus]|uniref:Uncharacterized protein LOC128776904 n=1 Tax=Panthera pardus TaxID=9691 RepID=A0A9W2VGN0_PANPR|nr:uncharacterized protein LOC128776904 [Panthera pardus]